MGKTHAGIWSEDRSARMAALRSEGLSASEIARALSTEFGVAFTRSMILGKMHRAKLPTRAEQLASVALRRKSG